MKNEECLKMVLLTTKAIGILLYVCIVCNLSKRLDKKMVSGTFGCTGRFFE